MCFNKKTFWCHISTFCEFWMQLRKNGTFSDFLLKEEIILPIQYFSFSMWSSLVVFNIAIATPFLTDFFGFKMSSLLPGGSTKEHGYNAVSALPSAPLQSQAATVDTLFTILHSLKGPPYFRQVFAMYFCTRLSSIFYSWFFILSFLFVNRLISFKHGMFIIDFTVDSLVLACSV